MKFCGFRWLPVTTVNYCITIMCASCEAINDIKISYLSAWRSRCDRGLKNAVRGRRQAEDSFFTPRSQFFAIRTDP